MVLRCLHTRRTITKKGTKWSSGSYNPGLGGRIATGTANATAVSTGGTHINGAELDAVITALFIFNRSVDGNAPILLDGRIPEGKVGRANILHFLFEGTEVVVQGIKLVAEMIPNETLPGKSVLFAAQVVKRFKYVASQLDKRAFTISKFTERRTRINQVFITSSVSGGQDGAEKEGEVHGKELHDGWVGEFCFRCCQSREIVRR
jgi:hypothetical protein